MGRQILWQFYMFRILPYVARHLHLSSSFWAGVHVLILPALAPLARELSPLLVCLYLNHSAVHLHVRLLS